jgi:hypothetical protein
MRLTGSYGSLLYDEAAHRKYVQRRMREIFLIGVKAFVNEAKNTIPVWSGASREALTQIAGFAGVPVFGAGPSSRVLNTTRQPQAPNRAGQGAASESFTVDESQIGTGKIFFRWSSNLFYLIANDTTDMNAEWGFHLHNPGPYHLHQHCSEAYKAAVNEEFLRFQLNTRQFLKVVRRQIR